MTREVLGDCFSSFRDFSANDSENFPPGHILAVALVTLIVPCPPGQMLKPLGGYSTFLVKLFHFWILETLEQTRSQALHYVGKYSSCFGVAIWAIRLWPPPISPGKSSYLPLTLRVGNLVRLIWCVLNELTLVSRDDWFIFINAQKLTIFALAGVTQLVGA